MLPWAPTTGWMLCDMYFGDGRAVPFSTRHLYRQALRKLAEAGFDYLAGLEVEFHVFKLDNPRLSPTDASWPGEAPEVSLISQGYQYLTETRFDQVEPMLETVRREVIALGLPLRSVELELGPSQCEFTFQPQVGLAPADTMMLFRSAVKQICRRLGYHATFMCRPKVANLLSSGWHLHQSLRDRRSGANAFMSNDKELLSRMGRHYLAGLLTHARAAAAFSTPTINGYKRYRGYSLAPDRAIWGRDNRGVMIRVLGGQGDAGDAAGEPHRRASRESLSLHGLADLHGARRHGADARSRCLGGHALRGQGAAVAEEPGGSARRAAPGCLPDRGLRPQFRRLLSAHQGSSRLRASSRR